MTCCAARFEAERQGRDAGLADIFDRFVRGMAEWIVATPGGEQMLQTAYFGRGRTRVIRTPATPSIPTTSPAAGAYTGQPGRESGPVTFAIRAGLL
jgi:hypothetical protein